MPFPFDDSNPYSSLANITQPQMMPNAPVGGGAYAGLQYAQDKQTHEGAVRQAMQQAALLAQIKQMAAGEYSQGAPGRLADIQRNNLMSQARLNDTGTDIETMGTQSKTKLSEAQRAQMNSEMDKVSDYARIYQNAQSPEEKQAVIDLMKQNGIKKIVSRNIDDIPPDKMDNFMKGAFQRQVNTPAQEQKLQQEKQLGENALGRVTAQEQLRTIRQQLHEEAQTQRSTERNQALKDVQDLKNKSADEKKSTIEQIRQRMAAGTATEHDRTVYDYFALTDPRVLSAQVLNANKPDNVNLEGVLPPGMARPPVTKPVMPPAPDSGKPNTPTAAAPKAGNKPPVKKDEALRILRAFKGTPQYAEAAKFYKDTYGEDAPE